MCLRQLKIPVNHCSCHYRNLHCPEAIIGPRCPSHLALFDSVPNLTKGPRFTLYLLLLNVDVRATKHLPLLYLAVHLRQSTFVVFFFGSYSLHTPFSPLPLSLLYLLPNNQNRSVNLCRRVRSRRSTTISVPLLSRFLSLPLPSTSSVKRSRHPPPSLPPVPINRQEASSTSDAF